MSKHVLIAYGTRYGSTAEISERMGEIFTEKGMKTEVRDLKKDGTPTDLDEYDLVVVGSGILAGRWTKEPLKFLEQNKEKLAEKSVALFVVSAYAADSEKHDRVYEDYLVSVAEDLKPISPVSMGFFGGVIDFSKYNFAVRILMKRMVSSNAGDREVSEYMDLRDWEEIESWAKSLVTE
ncbi:nitric oxide synthase [Candidatus Thorarchaeota archaeon]|nr:MAG: nitric oxide synthase [Candidatus Thorarchaeota archaeon]